MPDVLPPAPPMFTNAPDVAPQQPSSQGNGLAVAGLVMGILAVVLCWVTLVNFVLGVLGIVFGAIGMAKAKKVGGKNRGWRSRASSSASSASSSGSCSSSSW